MSDISRSQRKVSYWTQTYDKKGVRTRLLVLAEQGRLGEIPAATYQKITADQWVRKPSRANNNKTPLSVALAKGMINQIPAHVFGGVKLSLWHDILPLMPADQVTACLKKILAPAYQTSSHQDVREFYGALDTAFKNSETNGALEVFLCARIATKQRKKHILTL